MKFRFKFSATAFLILLLLNGCVRELVPTQNDYQAKVVVWAILDPNKNIRVITSSNRGLSDNDVVNIPEIDIMVYEDGVLIENLTSSAISSDTVSHFFSFKPEPNHNYTLRLSNISTEIKGSTFMMPIPDLPVLDLTKGENARLKYSITDNALRDDAYQFDVKVYFRGVLRDTADNSILNADFKLIRKFDKYDEPSLVYNFAGLGNSVISDYTFPVNDDLFNGKTKDFLFSVQNPVSDEVFVQREGTNGLISDKLISSKRYIIIKCRKIAPEYYSFMLSEGKNNAIFGTPYFNPTNLFTNVNGGLGLVAAVNERVDTVWIKK
jgi:hypothetical protein